MIEVEKISSKDWSELFSEKAHSVCFGKHKPASQERIDYALVVARDNFLMGYVTCRELDSETVYWQFGGAFPGTKETSLSFRGYQAFVDHCKPRYQRIVTLIENTNLVMLKMAMKVGFRIQGVRLHTAKKERTVLNPDSFTAHVLVELVLECPHG